MMTVELFVDLQISNGFELKNHHEIFIPKNDLTKLGRWFHHGLLPSTADEIGRMEWSFRLYFSTLN